MLKFSNLFMLLAMFSFAFFSCEVASSSSEEAHDPLEEAQEELVRNHLSKQDKAFNAVDIANIGTVSTGTADATLVGHQGYLVTVGGKTTLPLKITENGEYLVMHNDANSSEFKIVDAKGAEIAVEKAGKYGDSYYYVVFDYAKKTLTGITDDKNIPYVKFATTSATFKVAHTAVGGDHDHD